MKMSEATTYTIRVQKEDFAKKVKDFVTKKSQIKSAILVPFEAEQIKEANILLDMLSVSIDDVVIITKEDFVRYY